MSVRVQTRCLTDASDVGFVVVQALTNLRQQSSGASLQPEGQARARELAVGSRQEGSGYGSIARVAHVPIVGEPLLDALALDRTGLGDDVAALVRQHRLVPQSKGIETAVTAAGIAIRTAGGYANADAVISVGADGAVVATFDVGGSDQFGSMRVDPGRLAEGIHTAGAFARAAWETLDEREIVQHVAIALAIPDAQNKVFSRPACRRPVPQQGQRGLTQRNREHDGVDDSGPQAQRQAVRGSTPAARMKHRFG